MVKVMFCSFLAIATSNCRYLDVNEETRTFMCDASDDSM